MKFITKQQQEEAAKTTMIGMLKGGILGLGLAIPALHFASKRYPTIRAIPPVQRGWLLLISTLGVGMTNAELSYEAYLKSQWHGRTAEILRREQAEEEAGIQALSLKGRALHWAKDNRFGIIGMSWVTAMAISGGLVFALSQKIVQVRMYAQGVTIAVLLASAGLSAIHLPDEEALEHNEKLRAPGEAEAWKHMIDNSPSNAQRVPYTPPSHHHDAARQSSAVQLDLGDQPSYHIQFGNGVVVEAYNDHHSPSHSGNDTMKIVTKEEQEEAARVTMWGAFRGGVLGLTIAAPSLYIAGVLYPKVRRIPIAQKTWLMMIATLGFGMTNAELTYNEYLTMQRYKRIMAELEQQ
ncbi:unnamed protein product [Rhizoctonia solani]|uniref:HIG1 domain-containing protein n=1 Tax=Rhizoctonia solani TaxID=456999 RepID=A0A8H3HKF5_9AGAM|nr:unnamed protein product [Rhizoctonia solani]